MQKTLNHTDQHHGCVIIMFVTAMSNVAYSLFDPKHGSQIKTFFLMKCWSGRDKLMRKYDSCSNSLSKVDLIF
jgi:hypothetical protein